MVTKPEKSAGLLMPPAPANGAEANGLRQHVAAFISLSPAVLQLEPAAITARAHDFQYAPEIQGIALKVGLAVAPARPSDVEVASVLNQDLYLGFGDAAWNEMAVVQGQGQSWNVSHQPSRRLRMGSQRADVGFDSVDDAVLVSLFHPPTQLVHCPAPKSRRAFRRGSVPQAAR